MGEPETKPDQTNQISQAQPTAQAPQPDLFRPRGYETIRVMAELGGPETKHILTDQNHPQTQTLPTTQGEPNLKPIMQLYQTRPGEPGARGKPCETKPPENSTPENQQERKTGGGQPKTNTILPKKQENNQKPTPPPPNQTEAQETIRDKLGTYRNHQNPETSGLNQYQPATCSPKVTTKTKPKPTGTKPKVTPNPNLKTKPVKKKRTPKNQVPETNQPQITTMFTPKNKQVEQELPTPNHQTETNLERESQTPDRDTRTPDLDLGEKNGTPETKPPKPNRKVVRTNEIKLFLAAKKTERELKLRSLAGNIVENSENTPSMLQCSTTLPCINQIPPNPLLPSAHGTRYTRNTALPTARIDGDKKTRADVTGIQD